MISLLVLQAKQNEGEMTTVKAGHVVYTTGDDTIIAAKGSYVIGYGVSNTILKGSGMTFIGTGSNAAIDASFGKDDIYLAQNSLNSIHNLAPGSTLHVDNANVYTAFDHCAGLQLYVHGTTQAMINDAFSHPFESITRVTGHYTVYTIGTDHFAFATPNNQTIDIHQFHAA